MTDAKLIYDDDCGFCSWWASFFAQRSDMGIVGFSELTDEERERLPEDWEECVHLLTDDEVYSCGAAVERAFTYTDVGETAEEVFGFLRQFEDYRRLRERLYRAGADHRALWGEFVSGEPPARREGK